MPKLHTVAKALGAAWRKHLTDGETLELNALGVVETTLCRQINDIRARRRKLELQARSRERYERVVRPVDKRRRSVMGIVEAQRLLAAE